MRTVTSSQDLPDRVGDLGYGVSSAEALAGAEALGRALAQAAENSPRCPRCKSPRWVSVSLDGGWSRKAQCVPCGAYHPGTIGPGSESPRFGDPDAVNPAYREVR